VVLPVAGGEIGRVAGLRHWLHNGRVGVQPPYS